MSKSNDNSIKKSSICIPVVPPSPNQPASSLCKHNLTYTSVVLKADSGASRHYLRSQDAAILRNKKTIVNSPRVSLPNNTVIQGNEQGHLPLNTTSLSTMDTQAHVFPNLLSASLLSLGQLCDDDWKIYLDRKNMQVTKDNKLVLMGTRNFQDGLWDDLR